MSLTTAVRRVELATKGSLSHRWRNSDYVDETDAEVYEVVPRG